VQIADFTALFNLVNKVPQYTAYSKQTLCEIYHNYLYLEDTDNNYITL
jgi:hypothetical protein